ncbi:hypothetical protein PHLGIDRAFT_127792 [Phlebiopsis gigantea 11061_1 CR5-6]|uniref:Rab-GAP TBC domain-containing protein n=1 Tax=Phlebiopsis gigantea (strain 11061_1 CR5-6) TaxID=745531 RepID=A0A0C3PLD7_PHLG1|nr:hypothetical protein PHLGIDRAFT_127792 [Phlebiopsis gigantea 11061_1 CR5-6]
MHDNEKRPIDATPSPATDCVQLEWDEIRQLSLRPGGLRDRRAELWTKLLHVEPPNISSSSEPDSTSALDGEKSRVVEPHPDERQVRLDTDRSFVLYPVVGDLSERESKQNELNDLIVEVFRKRRELSYFQGYHDIISVLFLTLPKEVQFPAAEKLSLHRLRDSMGSSLEPVIGLLRIVKRVLDCADPEYSASLNHTGKMPYYALSNLLTLFSHDMPTLPLVQHVFDYLLCRHPIAVVYLAAAVLLSRKAEVQRLQEEDEDGMVHSLLSSLPDIYDDYDDEETSIPSEAAVVVHEASSPSVLEESSPSSGASEEALSPNSSNDNYDNDFLSADESETDISSHPDDATLVDESSHTSELDTPSPSMLEDDPTLVSEETTKTLQHLQEPSTAPSGSFHIAPETTYPPEFSPRDEATSAPAQEAGVRRPRIHISALLEQADELLARYPPLDPPVSLEAVMGPNSVMRTWSEDPALLPSDDAAERMVASPHLVVLPPPLEDEEDSEAEKDEQEEREKVERERRHRRRLRKPMRIGSVVVEPKVVVGAALVLGVAMAVYGWQVTPQRHHSHTAGRELLRMCKYLGVSVAALGGRLRDGLVEMANV